MVLVGIDHRPAARDALALGRYLAEALSEDLLLVWVRPVGRDAGKLEAIFRLPGLVDRRLKTRKIENDVRALADDAGAALRAGLRCRLRSVAADRAADGLARAAHEELASMVVLGASERAGLGRIVPGSTAVRLLSSSAVPVAIAPRGYIPDSKREPLIGVGFDGGPEAEHALDWAATLALGVRGRLRMLAVHEPIAFGNVSTGAFPVQSVGQALRGQLKDEAEKAAAGLSRGPSPEILFKDGDPAGELIEASAELDLLVLGSRAHGPARSVLLGSVSEATVAGSQAPVVVVPRGHEKRTND